MVVAQTCVWRRSRCDDHRGRRRRRVKRRTGSGTWPTSGTGYSRAEVVLILWHGDPQRHLQRPATPTQASLKYAGIPPRRARRPLPHIFYSSFRRTRPPWLRTGCSKSLDTSPTHIHVGCSRARSPSLQVSNSVLALRGVSSRVRVAGVANNACVS